MQLVQLRYRADHVPGFGPFSCSLWHGVALATARARRAAPYTPAFVNRSLRGSSGAIVSSSFMSVRTRSSVGAGTTTWISTYWSPREPLRLGTPFSLRRRVLPLLVEGGMRTSERPSIVGTSTFAPR